MSNLFTETKLSEYKVEESEVTKIAMEVSVAKREAEIVSCCKQNDNCVSQEKTTVARHILVDVNLCYQGKHMSPEIFKKYAYSLT